MNHDCKRAEEAIWEHARTGCDLPDDARSHGPVTPSRCCEVERSAPITLSALSSELPAKQLHTNLASVEWIRFF